MDNPETLATLDTKTQDDDKKNKQITQHRKLIR